MPDDLMRLAERCEAATGPDRELDCDIGVAFGLFERDLMRPGMVIKDGRSGMGWPAFTASLDAAMTLAKPFMLVALSDIAADGLSGCCLCSDTTTNPPTEYWGVPSEVAPREQILARAVCAAALRAVAALRAKVKGDAS